MPTCRSCAQPIVWARTAKADKLIPLDAEPVRPGTPGALALVTKRGQGRAWGPDALATAIAAEQACTTDRAAEAVALYPHHLAHFATCPHADQHRSPR